MVAMLYIIDSYAWVEYFKGSAKGEILRALFLKEEHKLEIGTDYDWDENLARGIDYYTGAIFELKAGGKAEELTIGAGGRYDNLIGMFVHPDRGRTKKDIPAVGFSFGIDRLIEAIDDTK